MKRELFAFVAIPILVAIFGWAPAWGFLIILGAATLLACDEYLKLARVNGVVVGRWIVLLLLTALLVTSWLDGVSGMAVSVLATLVILPTVRLARPESPQGSLTGLAVESFAVLYLGTTAACLGWLRLWPVDPSGVKILFFYLATIWIGDSGAYYVGKNFGRHKMAPRISPNKTLEVWRGASSRPMSRRQSQRIFSISSSVRFTSSFWRPSWPPPLRLVIWSNRSSSETAASRIRRA